VYSHQEGFAICKSIPFDESDLIMLVIQRVTKVLLTLEKIHTSDSGRTRRCHEVTLSSPNSDFTDSDMLD
jgi:hypothetical protein